MAGHGARVELEIAGAWTDVTDHVRKAARITHMRGRRSPSAPRIDSAELGLTLESPAGLYDNRNPRSPYFGKLGRNTPLRLSVAGPESYLAVDGVGYGATGTTDPATRLTGDIDLRVEVSGLWVSSTRQHLIGRWRAPSAFSFLLFIEGGFIQLSHSSTGAPQWFAVRPLPVLPERAVIRATLDVNNGGGGWTAAFFWSETWGGPWTPIGDPVTIAGTTSLFAGTAPLEIIPPPRGVSPPTEVWAPMDRRVYRAEVRSGIGGTVVAAPDFRGLTPGTTAFTDSAGRAWTVTGTDSISAQQYLFYGEVPTWEPTWHTSGHDVRVPIRAAGIKRRLGTGQTALQSTLRRRIPSAAGLLAYWPMEDGRDATQLYSPLAGVRPLRTKGLQLAADDSLFGSSALPQVPGGTGTSWITGSVPRATTQGWHVEMAYRLPATPTVPQTEVVRLTLSGSAVRTVRVVIWDSPVVRIDALDVDGNVIGTGIFNLPEPVAAFVGSWNRLQLYVSPTGTPGQIYITAAWRDVITGIWWRVTTGAIATTMGTVTGIDGSWGTAVQGLSIGHLAAFSIPATDLNTPAVTVYEGADDGFFGETASARVQRLGTEEALPVLVLPGDTERMGPQRPAALLELLEQCEDTDDGRLSEARDRLALVYRPRSDHYTQTPALTLSYGQVTHPFTPVEADDVRNIWTVSRDGGSSATVALASGPLSIQPPPAGIGPYEEPVTLSLYEDAQTEPHAAWRLGRSTWDEYRYPSVRLLLHKYPGLVPAVLALREGDLIRITDLPAHLPPGPLDLIIEGWSESLTDLEWTIDFVCSPGGPWRVGVVGTDRVDSDNTTLGAGISASATSLILSTIATPWISSAAYPTDFPLDITIGGEVMTVTAITGAASPQTATVVRAVNGVALAHAAGTPVHVAQPAIVAL